MSKIYCNNESIIDNVLPEMQNALVNLKKAIKISNNIVIPSDFGYYRSLKDMFFDVKEICNDIKNDADYLNEICVCVKNTILDIEDNILANSYKNFDLEVRKNIIQ